MTTSAATTIAETGTIATANGRRVRATRTTAADNTVTVTVTDGSYVAAPWFAATFRPEQD